MDATQSRNIISLIVFIVTVILAIGIPIAAFILIFRAIKKGVKRHLEIQQFNAETERIKAEAMRNRQGQE